MAHQESGRNYAFNDATDGFYVACSANDIPSPFYIRAPRSKAISFHPKKEGKKDSESNLPFLLGPIATVTFPTGLPRRRFWSLTPESSHLDRIGKGRLPTLDGGRVC